MDCFKCGYKLWGSSDSSECTNDNCSDVEPIPVPYVWGCAWDTSNKYIWNMITRANPQYSSPIFMEPIPFKHPWQERKYKGAMQEVRDGQKNPSND